MKKICAISTVEATMIQFIIPAMRVMKENGYEVTLVCAMTDKFYEEYSKEFTCINLQMKRGLSIVDLIKMPFVFRKLFKKGQYDLVQYATPNASFYASLGALMARVKRRVYCQWGIRYVGSSGVMRLALKLLEKITCMCSTHIRPASWKNLDYAVAENLYNRDKASVIGDGGTVGIDLSEYDLNNKEANKSAVYEQYPQLQNKVVFGFVGRFNRDKGINELLEAFDRLQQKYENLALLLIGEADESMPQCLEFVAHKNSVVTTGWTKEVPKYLAAVDVLVHPSYREGFSMVIQQAMALEIPVVTTDIPGPSEVIENNVTGVLALPRDIDTLYEKMCWMMEHPENRAVMGKAGRLRCEKLFPRAKMLQLTYIDRVSILNS